MPALPLQDHCHLAARHPIHLPAAPDSWLDCSLPQTTNESCVCSTDDELFSGDTGVDLLIEDQLLRHEDLLTSATRRPATTRHGAAVTTEASVQSTSLSSVQASASATRLADPDQASAGQLLATTQSSTVFPEPTGAMPSTQVPPTTVAHTAIPPPPASLAPAMVPEETFVEEAHLVPGLPDTAGTDLPEEEETTGQEATSAGPVLSLEEEDDIRNVIGESSPLHWISSGRFGKR